MGSPMPPPTDSVNRAQQFKVTVTGFWIDFDWLGVPKKCASVPASGPCQKKTAAGLA